jgi:large subunit ribosomal protein L11
MAKKIAGYIKLQISGGKANPAPPIGPALGQKGVNIMDFCKKFNEATKDKQGTIVPVVISVYEDKSFDFIMKSPPASALIKKAAGLAKASGEPNKEKIGKISRKDIEEIAKIKMEDLNASKLENAMKMIEGSCQSMGIEVTG